MVGHYQTTSPQFTTVETYQATCPSSSPAHMATQFEVSPVGGPYFAYGIHQPNTAPTAAPLPTLFYMSSGSLSRSSRSSSRSSIQSDADTESKRSSETRVANPSFSGSLSQRSIFAAEDNFPSKVLTRILSFLDSGTRFSFSQACKRFFALESVTRTSVALRHGRSISPDRLARRFPNLRSLSIGCVRTGLSVWDSDSDVFDHKHMMLAPAPESEYSASKWIRLIVLAYPRLKELRLWNLVVTDGALLELGVTCGRTLEVLKLLHCRSFSAAGLASLSRSCPNLRSLVKSSCPTAPESGQWSPPLTESCGQLQEVDLTPGHAFSPSLSGLFGGRLSSLTRLVSLRMDSRTWRASSALSVAAANAETLTDLWLGECDESVEDQPQEGIAEALKSLVNLKSLGGLLLMRMKDVALIEPIVPQLSRLDLGHSYLFSAGSAIAPLCASNLRELALPPSGDAITTSQLGLFRDHCPRLEVLIVGEVRGDGIAPLRAISRGFPSLRTLSLQCRKLRGSLITPHPASIQRERKGSARGQTEPEDGIPWHCTNLTHLELRTSDAAATVESAGLHCIWEACPRLQHLSLHFGPHDTFPVNWPHLGLPRVSLPALQALAAHCPDLGTLHLSSCGPLDECLPAVASMRSLTQLLLQSCHISSQGITAVCGEACPRLRYVHVDGPNVDAEDLADTFQLCRCGPWSVNKFWATSEESPLNREKSTGRTNLWPWHDPPPVISGRKPFQALVCYPQLI